MPAIIQIVCPHCDQTNRLSSERLRDGGKCGACHQKLFVGKPLALDDEKRFEKHAAYNDIPLLVDMWAPWCGPCRAMAPVFEQAAGELEPMARVVKVDSDAVPGLSRRFGIQHIPTLLVVFHGNEIARLSGAMSLPQLLRWAKPHLDSARIAA